MVDYKSSKESFGVYVYFEELEYRLVTSHLTSFTLLISIYQENIVNLLYSYYILQISEQDINGEDSAVQCSMMTLLSLDGFLHNLAALFINLKLKKK